MDIFVTQPVNPFNYLSPTVKKKRTVTLENHYLLLNQIQGTKPYVTGTGKPPVVALMYFFTFLCRVDVGPELTSNEACWNRISKP